MTYWLRAVSRLRPRVVWFALGTGIFCCIAVTALILAPVLSLIGTGLAFAPFVQVPVTQIIIATIGGYILVLGLLTLTGLSRNGALSWFLASTATLLCLIVSLYPLFAVAFAAVDNAGNAIPWILDWIARIRGGPT
ncbi:hypothetical protein [Cryobacterium sp. PH31-O1]|uniref:hypothetical protein n=1 Tax=Cryobacterium sp. PH31-O1 TaxID=3046306 RepID=UPI0024B88CB0|nr:hypothetical protein [Cryobacterium sp. PH31-O1]MDJ0337913.1 hypothetical protein [Cryobacterium sp. PH31-O1]